MKTSISYTLLAAAMGCGFAHGQTTAYTTPVGYVSLGNVDPGAPNLPADTDIFVSVPLERSADWMGTVVSVDVVNSTITLNTSPDFAVNQWLPSVSANPATLDPFVLKVEGQIPATPSAGLIAQITANSADTVTIVVPPGDSLAGIIAGNSVSIRRAFTPQSLLAGNSLPSGIKILLYDGVEGIEPSFSGQYTYSSVSNSWEDEFAGGDASHNILFPSELLILRNSSAVDVTDLVVSGTVPTSTQRAILSVPNGSIGQDIPLSMFSSVGQLVTAASLPIVTGNQLLVYDNKTPGTEKSFSGQFTYNSVTGAWEDEFNGGDASSILKLEAGVSYFLRKPASTAVTGNTVWSATPSYVPSL